MSVARSRALAILAGGAAGALARAGVTEAIPAGPGDWPWATFAVNLAGVVVLAWLTTWLATLGAPNRLWQPLVGTGFCGALTTFSTLQVETITLATEGHLALAFAYASSSLIAGMALAVAATTITRRRLG